MPSLRRNNAYINDMIVDDGNLHIVSAFYDNALIYGSGSGEEPEPLSGLYRHWDFDTLYDSVADVPVQLFGNATLTGGALVLNGNGSTNVNYAQLSGNNFPAEYDGGITIEFWQTTTARRNWTRIYDFGTDSNNYTFMTTAAGSANNARAAVKCGSTEEYVNSKYMTPWQRWHVAVVYDLTS